MRPREAWAGWKERERGAKSVSCFTKSFVLLFFVAQKFAYLMCRLFVRCLFRTSLVCDLSRGEIWTNPSELMHPEIYIAKKTIEEIVRKNVSDTGQFASLPLPLSRWAESDCLSARVTQPHSKGRRSGRWWRIEWSKSDHLLSKIAAWWREWNLKDKRTEIIRGPESQFSCVHFFLSLSLSSCLVFSCVRTFSRPTLTAK